MDQGVTIALDAMGGDHAPASVIEGAALALRRHPTVRFLLFGDDNRIRHLLDLHPALKARATVVHTVDVVASDAKPSVALRQGVNSSMRLAIDAVKDGRAAGVVSSGNTGALLAMAKMVLKTLPGINRPALASVLPTLKHSCVMLDAGANIDCDARTLCQFAVMGDGFARSVLGITSPSIALLNVGTEEIKGHDTLKASYHALKNAKNLNFQGFCEGTDIGRGNVDVVITDGFTGNITLKTLEGTAHFVATSLKRALQSSVLGKLGFLIASSALAPFREKMDPRQHNGAGFIGLNGITVKSHGGADGIAFAHAIDVAFDLISHNVNSKILEELDRAGLDLAFDEAIKPVSTEEPSKA